MAISEQAHHYSLTFRALDSLIKLIKIKNEVEILSSQGRVFAVGVVGLFNILRYYYYHRYLELPFEASFFILTTIFLSIAWWGGKQYDLAKYYSEKDPLTNTYNRRTVKESFERLALISDKENNRLGVLMIDLDNFKGINDRYGHSKGDELLQQISFIMKKVSKKEDFIARWGGDEFLILVPNIDEYFEVNYPQLLHEELESNESFLNTLFTASIGVAIYPEHGVTLENLIQRADERMYKMKRIKHSISN